MGSDLVFIDYPLEWQATTLGELVDASGGSVQTGPFGSQLHASDYVEAGIPSVMPKNIAIDGIIEDDIARITHEDASRLSKYLLASGDIIYSRRGDVEKCALVKPEEIGWLCGTGCLRVRLGGNAKITPEFLHAYLSTPATREWVSRNAIGATMPNLNTSILRDVPVLVPESREINYITSSWNALNNKIQLNRQINKTLESMAQALFKSWFVDFDPVIDNALAAGSEIPEPLKARAEQRAALRQSATRDKNREPQLPEAIRQLFPSRFVFHAEMGWIPEGWEVVPFGNVSNCFDKHRVPLSKLQREAKQPGNIPYIGATSVNDYINEWIFDHIYLLIGEDGSVIKEDRSPFVQYIWGKTWVNNHAHVLQGSKGISTEHLMLFMQAQNVTAYVTGAVQMKINQKNMNSIPFLKAEDELNKYFGELVAPYYEKFRATSEANQSLNKLRDTLLPKLISGELRIPEAAQAVQEFETEAEAI